MRVLSISAQKPDSTGSGVYLAETVRAMIAAGHEAAAVVGIDRDDALALPAGARGWAVRFRTPDLPFPVCGMSDVMPYEATRYRDLTPQMTAQFFDAFFRTIREAMLEFKPDLVICHHLYLACTAAVEAADALAAEGYGEGWRRTEGGAPAAARPCSMWACSHSTDLRQVRSHALERQRIAAAVRSLDGVFSLHEAQAAEIAELFDVPAGRIRVVGTGYNAREFHRYPGLRREGGPVKVLYAGKICRAKGAESLMRALAALPFAPDEVEVDLIGGHSDEAQYDAVRALARGVRYPMRFLGRVPQDDLVRGYASAHVFVLPSFFEGLPLVVVEALACGCRVVVNDLPGIRPWIAASLPAAPVAFVELPRMERVDQPLAADLPAFEERLAAALEAAVRAARDEGPTACDATALSWDALASRMLAAAGA